MNEAPLTRWLKFRTQPEDGGRRNVGRDDRARAAADMARGDITGGEIAGQVELPDGTIVDIDAADAAVGVEVLRAWAPWDLAAIAERFHLSEDTV